MNRYKISAKFHDEYNRTTNSFWEVSERNKFAAIVVAMKEVTAITGFKDLLEIGARLIRDKKKFRIIGVSTTIAKRVKEIGIVHDLEHYDESAVFEEVLPLLYTEGLTFAIERHGKDEFDIVWVSAGPKKL